MSDDNEAEAQCKSRDTKREQKQCGYCRKYVNSLNRHIIESHLNQLKDVLYNETIRVSRDLETCDFDSPSTFSDEDYRVWLIVDLSHWVMEQKKKAVNPDLSPKMEQRAIRLFTGEAYFKTISNDDF